MINDEKIGSTAAIQALSQALSNVAYQNLDASASALMELAQTVSIMSCDRSLSAVRTLVELSSEVLNSYGAMESELIATMQEIGILCINYSDKLMESIQESLSLLSASSDCEQEIKLPADTLEPVDTVLEPFDDEQLQGDLGVAVEKVKRKDCSWNKSEILALLALIVSLLSFAVSYAQLATGITAVQGQEIIELLEEQNDLFESETNQHPKRVDFSSKPDCTQSEADGFD